MFDSEFPRSQVFILCPSQSIYNSCDQYFVSVYILYDGINVEEQEYLGFLSSFYQKSSGILDDITKRKLTKLKRTELFNKDEQHLNNIDYKDKKSYEK